MSTRKIPFQIVYGMNLRGVSELRDLEHSEFRSVGVEDFAAKIQELHNEIKDQLKKCNNEYKRRVDQHKMRLELEVGYQVLAHLQKEILPRETYNKLKLKKIGPCKILRKFGENSYEIGLPEDVDISPIFNIVYLYPYREYGAGGSQYQKEIQWKKKIYVAEKP
jgi:hypothetical protein